MLEEVLDLVLGLLRNIVDVLDVRVARVLGLYADHLLVDAAIVFHRKHANRTNIYNHTREHRELKNYQSV